MCGSVINTLKILGEEYSENKKNIFALFLDLEKAYTAELKLCGKFGRICCKCNAINVVKTFYSNSVLG